MRLKGVQRSHLLSVLMDKLNGDYSGSLRITEIEMADENGQGHGVVTDVLHETLDLLVNRLGTVTEGISCILEP